MLSAHSIAIGSAYLIETTITYSHSQPRPIPFPSSQQADEKKPIIIKSMAKPHAG